MLPELEGIIAQAYKTFEVYRSPISLDVCKVCCVTNEQEKLLISTPLHQLSVELLSVYNDSAKSGVERSEQLKYFLPKMLELIAQLQFLSHSCEICLERIGMTKEWKEKEIKILEQFAEIFFKYCLSLHYLSRNSESIDSILIMFDKAKIDIYPLLDMWTKQENYESVLWYCDIVLYGIKEKLNKKSLVNGFADESCSEKITNFIFDQKTKNHFSNRIEQIIINNTVSNSKDLETLNYAYELLR